MKEEIQKEITTNPKPMCKKINIEGLRQNPKPIYKKLNIESLCQNPKPICMEVDKHKRLCQNVTYYACPSGNT